MHTFIDSFKVVLNQIQTWMRDSGRPVAWDRLSRRLMPGYGSVSKVARRSSTCSLEKLVLFLRLALRAEQLMGATGRPSSGGGRQQVQWQKRFQTPNKKLPKRRITSDTLIRLIHEVSHLEIEVLVSTCFSKSTTVTFTVHSERFKFHFNIFLK